MFKRLTIPLILIFIGSSSIIANAQRSSFLQRVDVEAGWGANFPLRLEHNFFYSPDYIGFKSFYVGGSYNINKIWRLRATYAYNQLDDSGYSNLGVRRYKLVFEPTFDFISALQTNKAHAKPRFDIRFHGGPGLSLGQSMYLDRTDDVTFTFQLGGMPRLQIADGMFVTLDCVAVSDFGQKYDTHGVPAQSRVGVYVLSNLGLSYSFSH